MRKQIFLFLCFFSLSLFAEQKNPTIYEENLSCNYGQWDVLSGAYHLSKSTQSRVERLKIYTSRPAFDFCFAFQNFRLRPKMIFDPNEANSFGELALGYGILNNLELGAVLRFNLTHKSLKEAEQRDETQEFNTQVAAYGIYMPYKTETNALELFFKGGFDLIKSRIVTADLENQSVSQWGPIVAIKINSLWKCTERLTLLAGLEFSYEELYDSKEDELRNVFDLSFFPLSLRYEF